MPKEQLSAEYFNGWYTDQSAMPAVAEIMNRHTGFPPGMRATPHRHGLLRAGPR